MIRTQLLFTSQQKFVFCYSVAFLHIKPLQPRVRQEDRPMVGRDGFVPLHQNLGSRVGQAQPHESSTHKHGGSQQDGDRFGNADQGAKY